MPEDGGLIGQALIGLKPMNAWVHTYTKPQTSSTRSCGLGRQIHESVEDTKLSTNKQHTLSTVHSVRAQRSRAEDVHRSPVISQRSYVQPPILIASPTIASASGCVSCGCIHASAHRLYRVLEVDDVL